MSAAAAAHPRTPAHLTPTPQADPRRTTQTPALPHQKTQKIPMQKLKNFVLRAFGATGWPVCGLQPVGAMPPPPHAHNTIMPGTIRNRGASGKGLSSQLRAPPRVSRWATPPRVRLPSLPTLLVLSGLALSGCIPVPTGANGRWVGRLTPLAGTCEQASDAVLVVSPRSATFSPNNGTLLLRGHADASGHVTADLRTLGMNHQPYVLSFEGTARDGQITGTYLTPRCRASVILARG